MKLAKRFLFTLSICFLLGLAAAATPADQEADYSALVGTWDIELIDMGFHLEFVFKLEEGELSGEMIFEMGNAVMENIEFEDGELTFYVEFDAGGQVMGIDASGTIEENKITGYMASDMGTAEFVGTKREES